MEKLIITLLLFTAWNTANSQIKVEVKAGQLDINSDVADKKEIHLIFTNDPTQNVKITEASFNIATDGKIILFKDIINYKKVASEDKIIFWKKNELEENAQPLFFCKTEKIFVKELKKCIEKPTIKKTEYDFVSQNPFPIFQDTNNDELPNNKSNRYLIVDASSKTIKKINNSLFKAKNVDTIVKKNTFKDNFKKASALPVNSSLTIFVRNYNFHDLEKVTVDISGSDYSYNLSINDILKDIGKKVTEDAFKIEATSEDSVKRTKLTNNLSEVLDALEKYKSLNINDLYIIEQYKKNIYEFYQNHFKDFKKEDIEILGKIINWYPEYLSITPFSITVPENDEITVKVKLKNSNDSNISEMKVGVFKTSGGIGFNLGGMLYMTNLKNNAIYTQPSETSGNVRTFMDSENQNSVGVGINGEIYLRTGYLIRPTLNMGFFVPFDEDLTPIGAIGPGISIASKKVKFSFSWGLAIGKVNTIKDEYRGKEFDPTGISNEQLGEKVWQYKNYFGFGLTYNLTTN
ncbi:hypothetical protein [Flavobacterium sp. H122]|uniref:hypothetical protein n=1 Tax=Flavobacterium sp. H122 TaxID=2529860 RepID=UPI0010A9C412|nr:hypothetical protein [Flavobacterium sp. H122]